MIQENHSLARYGTYQIGGLADYFVEVKTEQELKEALTWADQKKLKSFVFGGASNLLFDDAGFRGLVVRIRLQSIEVRADLAEIQAEAGTSTMQVVKAAAEAGLSGMEAWNGLPGTVGGAVVGNAGCFGVETKDILKWAEVLENGKVRRLAPADLGYSYRNSLLKHSTAVVLRACFQLTHGEPLSIQEKMKEIVRVRAGKQPPGLSTGSFFKNPSVEQSAGFLIDQCGLKGAQLGQAQISPRHGNFFVNLGGATAQNILDLGKMAQDAVHEKFGLTLEREIVFVPAQ